MTFNIDVEKLPRKALETAVKLNDTLTKIYLTLYFCEKATTPKEIAKKLGYARAYVHMRLCQLECMGLTNRIEDEKRVKFEAKK
jgi:DNA-binding MarR family transcriptional regulator